MSRIRVDLSVGANPTCHARFELPSRGLACLVGTRNGGKSRLLRAIAGLDPAAGSIMRDGLDWQRQSARRRPVVMLFSEPRLLPRRDVRANLAFAGTAELPPAITDPLDLARLLDRCAADLSAAEAHRVALARALGTHPALLLVDEPAHLSAAERRTYHRLVMTLAERAGVPTLLATGSLAEAAWLSETVVLVDDGGVAAWGPLNELVFEFGLPLCRRDDAVTRVQGVVASHDPGHGITHVDTRGGRLCIPLLDRAPGRTVTITSRADRTWLSAAPPAAASSLLSSVEAEVQAVTDSGKGDWVVALAATDMPLLARVPERARVALQLEPGRPVHALLAGVEPTYG